MSENTKESSSLWQWLDWWCEPRWRALLTWLILAAFGTNLESMLGYERFSTLLVGPLRLVDRVSLFPVTGQTVSVVFTVNATLLYFWFEPFVLRLNLLRGIAWLTIRMASEIVPYLFIPWNSPLAWLATPLRLLSMAALGVVLWGWRSRPWLPFAWTLFSQAIWRWLIPEQWGRPFWSWFLLTVFPFAALMLYGTRLLRPEERHAAEPIAL